MSRKKIQRQTALLEQLAVSPTMRVNALAQLFAVTTETIRRDLEELAEQGMISRTYGGAVIRQALEPVVSERHKLYLAERTRIAQAAIGQLQDARVIMMGSGATTAEVARQMARQLNDKTVITHAFGVAKALASNPSMEIIMAPGSYHEGEAATHGAMTQRFLSQYQADVAVLGASGLDVDGCSDALMDAAEVYKSMVQQSSRVVLVADHSKFDRVALARWCGWSQLDCVISDRQPELPLQQRIEQSRADFVLAP